MSKLKMKNILSITAAIFGVVTLFASSSVLFKYSDILEKEGNYPPFILWVNLLSGSLYLLVAIGLKYSRKWTVFVLTGILTMLIYSLSFFIQLMISGISYETDTLIALLVRLGFTSILTLYAFSKNTINIKS